MSAFTSGGTVSPLSGSWGMEKGQGEKGGEGSKAVEEINFRDTTLQLLHWHPWM